MGKDRILSARARAALGERDTNHTTIVSRYESHLCLVHDTSTLGRSYPDIQVRIPTRRGGILQLVEIKRPALAGDGAGSLSKGQETFMRQWGEGCVAVVWDEGDVDAHIARVKERFR